MWKPLLLLAVTANTFLITPSEGSSKVVTTSQSCSSSSSMQSSSTASSSSSTSHSSGGGGNQGGGKSSSKVVTTSQSSSSSSSTQSRSTAFSSSSTSHSSGGGGNQGGGKTTTQPPCSPKCPKNEVFDPCPVTCPPRECGVNPAVILCPVPPKVGDPECEPACRCRDGYLRNYDGICIPKDKCPKCPRNEVYDICPAPCPPQRCDVDPRLIKCAEPPKPGDSTCEPGCRCVDGYVKNDDGICIPRDQCPKCPRIHEVWDLCPPTCPPQTCESIYAKYNCPKQPCEGSDDCVGACRCEPGYLRNKIGECISVEDCQKCRGPHEYFSCGVACDNVCATLKEQNQTSCPNMNIDCNRMCYCEADYARDENNICIPIDQCPKVPQCGVHEVYSNCPSYACRPQQCSEVGFPVACPAQSESGCPGKPGCICDVGYVRDDSGVCMPIGHCPSCGGDPNAVAGCGVNCGRRCSNYNSTDVACILVCYDNACDCRDGFVVDDNINKCVRPQDCTPVCGPNEVYSNCSNGGCGPKQCSELGFKIGCVKMDQKHCIGGCICKDGYLRDDNGKCIPKTECPACGGDPNAVTGCGVNCNRHCYDLNEEPHGCITVCYDDACDCREGYFFDDNTGKCVRPKDCTPQCGKNERFEKCPDTLCTPQNCSQLGFPWPAIPYPPPGDGPCSGPPACVCIDDYVRDDKGNCIPKKDCPSCGRDPNAVSGCGVNCGKLCSNYDKGPTRCPKICYPNACDCRDGYVLDENTKKCVRPEDCTPVCGPNEVYSNCSNGGCGPKQCSELGFKIGCVKMDQKHCIGGCICKDGYLRDDNGKCIPKTECPACGGDPNAVTGCGVNCNRHCYDLNEEPHECITVCYDDACDCREGYFFDDNTGKCVRPKDCTPHCGKNERFEKCPDTLCTPQNCSQLGFPWPAIPCPPPGDGSCSGPPACVCIDDYVRDDKGNCIPKKDCPSCGGDPNAVSGCGVNCGKLCSNHDKGPTRCPKICYPNACDCRDGYVLDENTKKCVRPEDCTPVCGPNEVYSNCSNGGCGPKQCSELGFKIGCVKMDQKHCIGGCICKDGYLRDDNGKCIPKTECPACGGDPNAVTGCGVNCNRHCYDLNEEPHECITVCYDDACDCREGYFFDDNTGKCVRPKDCTPHCGKNERFEKCPDTLCTPQNCSQLGFPWPAIPCPPPGDGSCSGPPACVCIDDYVRDDKGNCIPKKDCPSCGGDPNAVSGCGVNCGKLCSNHDKGPTRCPKICYPNACDCRDGYVLDENTKKCVRPEDCTPVCGPNEVYSNCSNGGCGPKQCSELGFKIGCVKMDQKHCIGGCICKDGYLRDDNGKCIPKTECPACGGDPNAVTGCGVNCNRHCYDLNEEPHECITVCYDDACDCREGYFFDDNTGKCVRPKDCTPHCGKNERFEKCPDTLCTPQNCSQLGFPWPAIPCPPPGDGSCSGPPACVCIDDYVRDDKGNCIPKKDCPSCGGDPNAVSGCGVNCGKLCSNYDKGPTRCPKICYPNACDCRDGYVLDENTKKCVRPEDCTPVCGPNEVYSNCSNGGCGPKQCSELGFKIGCVKMDQKHCIGGCICKDGYLRDDNGKCIPKTECPACGGDPNAVTGCGVNCNRHCYDLNEEPHGCITVCYDDACDCREGYFFDDNTGKCVRPKDCTPHCGKNERFEKCPDTLCTPQNCSQLGFPWPAIPCPPPGDGPCSGPPACVCIDDYVRDDKGNCIPIKDCPSCGRDPNAVSGCGVNCGKLCSNYDKGPTRCPKICYPNACDCRDGYVLDENTKKCVRPEDCTPQCADDERYEECPDSLCYPRNCSQLGFPIACPASDCAGKPACVCDNDNVRDENGKCIPKDQCPSCGGDPNAVSGCGINCGRRCSNYKEKNVVCALICKLNGCDCRKGYVYDDNIKKCVRPEDCTPTCGINEVYDNCANGGCRKRTCSQPIICVRPKECEGGCICQDGYTRNDNGTCIPIDECPPPICPDGETFQECPEKLCIPKECSELGFPLECTDPDAPCPGDPDCICDDGNVRDDNGNCIPRHLCPSCGGDPNATPGCGSNCGRRCSDYMITDLSCPLSCSLNGCDCKDGFLYDDNLEKCVLPEECTPVCGVNEVYDGCANGGCRRRTCNKAILCVDPIKCEGGCICQKGHVRDDNDQCIPVEQCPTPLCPDDQRYEICPDYLCEPTSCSQLGFPINCTDPSLPCPGEPDCVCDYGNVKDAYEKCIPKNECPSCGGDPNAESGCGGNCGRRCSDYKKEDVACPLICMLNGCDCREGYVFDDNINKCVRPEDCTPTCGLNEVYDSCANGGCRRWTCEPGILCIDPIECEGGCICQDGYVRNDDGVCIPIDQCPNECNQPHEYYDDCPSRCPPQTCESIGQKYHCPKSAAVCIGACRCEKGYYRNKIGECISEKNCKKCIGPHEYFSCGGACDNVCSTIHKQNKINCPIINSKCKPKCYCEDGYARDENNVCIPIDQCPVQPCGPNERFEQCPPALCTPQSCSQLGFPIDCPEVSDPINNCPGPPACVCDYGYVRDAKGNCIRDKDCPSCGGDSNATPGCGVNCGRLCSNYDQGPVPCPKICYFNACDCKKGYVYDENTKKCVRPKDCTPKCPKGQRFVQCPPALCAPQTCSEVGFPVPCPDLPPNGTCPEPPACLCNEDTVKNDNGNCIPMKKCPSCGGDPNAVSGCGNHCGNQCSDYKKKDVACPLVCYYNACDCKKGYVYDENQNKCVRPKDCSPTCGKNEIYDICANGGCNKRNCSQLGEPMICIDPIECQGGCVCEQGYLRANNGTCVPESQCPDPCRKPHEYYDPCLPTCPPQTCDSLDRAYICPILLGGPQYCNGACRCETGYYRNAIGECISENDCLKCTSPNEYFSCGSACDNVCATLGKQNQTHCPIINKKCTPKCYCVEGYARDDNNICIPIEQCGGSCKGDPNAIRGCGINCGKHCYDYKNGPIGFCPEVCQIHGCDCKDNYFFDDNIGKCVLPKNCTPTCGENEVFDDCINGCCQKTNCSQVGKPDVCVHPEVCIKGCLCKDGYLRHDNGTCVPIDQCQETCNGDPNAEPGCGINCGRRCSNYDKPPPACALGCIEGGCDCKPDYVFDDNLGKCVLPKDCTPICKRNEVYNACANGGCEMRKCSELTKPINCTEPEECIGDCVCVEGYLRDDNGVCAPIHECHPACGPHEFYDPCPANCPPNTCESIGKACSCPGDIYQNCRGTCVCEAGYYRNLIGECISKEDCLKCTGPHEYFSCGEACDNVCSILSTQNQTNCPVENSTCYPRCYCEAGYARNSENICIPIGDCPAPAGEGCGDTGTSSPPSNLNNTDIQARLNRGTIALSSEFIYQLTQSRPNENFVCSATSLLIPLAQITIFARDLTLQQLLRVQNLSSKDEITSIYPDVIESYKNQQEVEFEVANRYYFSVLYELSKNFQEISQRVFDSAGENVDFSKNQEAAKIINDFVNNKTHGRIQDLVSPDMLDAYTVVVLVNAIYFKGNWVHQFNPNDTQKRDFTRRDNSVVQLDTMYQENTFNYAEDNTLGIQALELPYKNQNFSFLAILPQQGCFDAVVQALRDPTVFENIVNSLKPEKVQVYLPKMLINTDLDLAEMLQKNNVTAMFDPSANGFQGILKDDKPVYVSAVVQKTFFQCDETGSEAAAATAIIVGVTSATFPPPESYIFDANRSFICYLMYNNAPLFAGAFVGAIL